MSSDDIVLIFFLDTTNHVLYRLLWRLRPFSEIYFVEKREIHHKKLSAFFLCIPTTSNNGQLLNGDLKTSEALKELLVVYL